MKWEVRGMRRGRPGRWTIDASSRESAQQKAEAAGVTLGRIDPIGQITSATVAFALAPGSRPAKARWPAQWIAACLVCAVVFGAGGYLLGYHIAQTATPGGVETPAELRNDGRTIRPTDSGRPSEASRISALPAKP